MTPGFCRYQALAIPLDVRPLARGLGSTWLPLEIPLAGVSTADKRFWVHLNKAGDATIDGSTIDSSFGSNMLSAVDAIDVSYQDIS